MKYLEKLEFDQMGKVDENQDFKKLAIMDSQQNTSGDTMT